MKEDVAKIVATPTLTSWSQAYHAGNLSAALSLTKQVSKEEEGSLLAQLGKEILNFFEAEYFGLEEKNLSTIKEAISTILGKIPEEVFPSLAVVTIPKKHPNILYAFTFGEGKIVIKREEKVGTILKSEDNEKEIQSASGFIEDKDLIILETKQFAGLISNQTLQDSLNHNSPAEIAENISPKIHEQEEGGAAATIIAISIEQAVVEEVLPLPETSEIKHPSAGSGQAADLESLKNKVLQLIPKTTQISHPRRVFLSLAIILVLVLVVSIFFAIKKQGDAKIQAQFQDIYSSAQKKYEEGQSLVPLNKNLARDDFSSAQKILNEGKTKFSSNSKEEKQITELLGKVEDSLTSLSGINKISAKVVNENVSDLLNLEIKNSGGAYFFTQDEKNVYFITNSEIISIDKKTKSPKSLIKNNGSWENAAGIGIYFGNFYVLDKKSNQIIKLSKGDNGFSKTNYLANNVKIDFSKAQSIAIDGSIWVIFQNGEVLKFTRGKADSFKISGLPKPISKSTRVATDINTGNLYILDNGSSSIVVINKDGSYQTTYSTDILKDAADFEVKEEDKKIFVLQKNKIYQIDLP